MAESFLDSRRRTPIKISLDFVLICTAALWAWYVSFSQVSFPADPLPFILVVMCVRLPVHIIFDLHKVSWRNISRYDATRLAAASITGSVITAVLFRILPDPFNIYDLARPYLLFFTESAFNFLLLSSVRMAARAIASSSKQAGANKQRQIVIVGAGAAGMALAYQIQETMNGYKITGFVDDDPQKKNYSMRGIPVLGPTTELVDIVRRTDAEEIIIAIPSLAPERLRSMMTACEVSRIPIRILPPLKELIGGKADFAALRELRMEDLLPRAEVKLDKEAITGYLHGRTVLVTGGGGSIGSELCRQAMAAGASQLLILGRGENSVFEIHQELGEHAGACDLLPVICDVQDYAALENVFSKHKPDVVFHAAAHKHVPLMEHYPYEAIKNNIIGTRNVAALAVKYNIKRFVLVSTDKAVRPSSVMGATKRMAEKIVKAHAAVSDANMVSVRFGNVLGSRGSVVGIMTRQIRKRLPVTVTDPEMVRYFMTIPEAVQLILQAGAIGGRGEVFVMDMGHPVRILDLAHDLIRLSGLVPNQDIPIRITGQRPGEKIREELFTVAEEDGAVKRGHFYIAPPENIDLQELTATGEKLQEAAHRQDVGTITAILKEAIPSFTRTDTAKAKVSVKEEHKEEPINA
ncbi:MAG: nucleoside-diphosphate sugar epimerase/dehydratase [bacterium]|nr:nucleoside-diphosphate sugar epimerase/dehydratase [bacterium]